MELIGKISKGTKMDQIYIKKNREGFEIGDYVLIKPVKEEHQKKEDYFFYNVKKLEGLKIKIIEEVFNIVEKILNYDNILIAGSFLEKGYNFNDLDIIIITKEKIETNNTDSKLKKEISKKIGVNAHCITIDYASFIKGVSTDPLYRNIISKFVSKKRIVIKKERKIIPELLDLNLLKSKDFAVNFDVLTGREKYYLLKNMIAISLFLNNKDISKENIDRAIIKEFGEIRKITENQTGKKEIISKFNKYYDRTFKEIAEYLKKDG
jgi:hypothetical protein